MESSHSRLFGCFLTTKTQLSHKPEMYEISHRIQISTHYLELLALLNLALFQNLKSLSTFSPPRFKNPFSGCYFMSPKKLRACIYLLAKIFMIFRVYEIGDDVLLRACPKALCAVDWLHSCSTFLEMDSGE